MSETLAFPIIVGSGPTITLNTAINMIPTGVFVSYSVAGHSVSVIFELQTIVMLSNKFIEF